ncbi:unnamed protein product [[Actinomadura] parvosata subsp. kistnae]|uniref:Uncharacterized protein n=1 Tax=[Actinomadura] parvosata subsp. kistnae TaxID=1909395 RepID=A0A1V0AHU3_9ACTN|nr:hypothetical protein [Nonomuraea sp. ATCC 55076]AQZ69787.1 hypothetical protein BKM31_57430 [Nonomuraea sp. ATCC 55076]SPL90070.1 unnamed protein product [Actinomadura parvosata subsp. kistnae]
MLSTVFNAFNLILTLIVLLGGVALMAVRRKEHERASVVGMAGCIVLLVGGVVSIVFSFLTPSLVDSMGYGGYQTLAFILGAISMLMQAIGTGLLIAAVVMPRKPQPQQGAPGAWQQGWQPQGQPEWQPGPQPGQPGQPGWQPGPQQQPPGWQTPPQPPFGPGQS